MLPILYAIDSIIIKLELGDKVIMYTVFYSNVCNILILLKEL